LLQESSPQLDLAIAQFNRSEFYACHDTLEAIWNQAEISDRNFYQGLLQLAVAHYHLENYNWRGTAILLGEGISRLRHFQPQYMDLDIEHLVRASAELLTEVQNVGADQFSEFVQHRLAKGNCSFSIILA
jgi:uncharacterized protein